MSRRAFPQAEVLRNDGKDGNDGMIGNNGVEVTHMQMEEYQITSLCYVQSAKTASQRDPPKKSFQEVTLKCRPYVSYCRIP